MVSAVFHTPGEAQQALRQAQGERKSVRAEPVEASRRARTPIDWREFWRRVLPPMIGFALLIAIWGVATQNSTTFPTPAKVFDAAVKLFADPFYRNGPNDQGIGWNVLYSLERSWASRSASSSAASRS
jgi:nitrate/nitrite transport system permease protein